MKTPKHRITIQHTHLSDGSPVFRVILKRDEDVYYFDCNSSEDAICFAETLRKCVTIYTNDLAEIK